MVKTIEAVVRKLWLSPENAVEEVVRFERRFGEENFKLACHCGLFLILTPELVNLIRINFLDEENIPWIGESNFCCLLYVVLYKREFMRLSLV